MLLCLRLALLALFIGVSFPSYATENGQDVVMIDSLQLQKKLSLPEKPFLLDVREPSEYEAGHIEGATLIPLGTLPDHLNEIPKDRPVVVYCRSGARSARAVSLLKQKGYTQIENLIGGMSDWSKKCATDKTYC